MTIPLMDLRPAHASLRSELESAIARVIAHGSFINGPEVATFEEEWALYCDAPYAVGVSSGTDALTLALRAAGIGPGDEVVTTAMTFPATAESIAECGASPVLVDPELTTGLISAPAVEAAITPRTAAVVPVHLYGQMVDVDAFRALTHRHGLLLAEDAAQAHGARWNGRRAGSAGDVAAFSFFPGKNLGAFGDAGAVTVADEDLARRIARLRNHGRSDKHRHDELGVNARLDTLQAAVLSVKLRRLEEWNARRRQVAATYDRLLADVDGIVPLSCSPPASSVWHQYVVRVANRDEVVGRLADAGVSTGVHYALALHEQPALAGVAVVGGGAPNAECLAREVLSLPMFPELDDARVEQVVGALSACVAAGSGAR
jgi:dTDP-4-amino-4,6-dideoxygalactose transaminase